MKAKKKPDSQTPSTLDVTHAAMKPKETLIDHSLSSVPVSHAIIDGVLDKVIDD